MKILLHDYSGHPFQIQLSRSLARRCYDVLHVYSGSFQTPHGALTKRVSDPPNLEIAEIRLPHPFQKYSFVKRRNQEIEYGHLLVKEVNRFRPDVVISSNTPLDAQNILTRKCQRDGIRFIFWLQDIYSVAITKILRKNFSLVGSCIGLYYHRLEKVILQKSDEIVAITEDFLPVLTSMNIDVKNIHVIHNWAPLEEIPSMPKVNQWSKENGLDQKFCFLYSGTLGLKHNPQIIVELALHFKDDDIVRIVVISEGIGSTWLEKKKSALNINNLMVLKFQPYNMLPHIFATADVLMAILDPDASVFSVLSKVLSYLCAGRPLLLSVPLENLATRIVKTSGAGIVSDPSDSDGFIEHAEHLYQNKALSEECGKRAMMYAKEYFNIETITDKFERIIYG